MKCEWERLTEQIAVERENNKKLEKAEMLEAMRERLSEMKDDDWHRQNQSRAGTDGLWDGW